MGCKIDLYKPIKKRRPFRKRARTRRSFLLLRQYTVFNIDQVNGDHLDQYRIEKEVPSETELPRYDEAERLILATAADIRFEGDQAFYRMPIPAHAWPHHTGGDFIVMPCPERLQSPEAYYETAFHELSHWSEIRLGLDLETRNYAQCELVAEMSAGAENRPVGGS